MLNLSGYISQPNHWCPEQSISSGSQQQNSGDFIHCPHINDIATEPTEDEKKHLLSAPHHNLRGRERVMGMLDAYHKRSNNANILYMESLVKSRSNSTVMMAI